MTRMRGWPSGPTSGFLIDWKCRTSPVSTSVELSMTISVSVPRITLRTFSR
jgi:hypothetical protein